MTERDLFIAALKITEPAERSTWLDRECGGDAALRLRIDVLLLAFDKAGSLLESPIVAGGPTIDEPTTELTGTVIGPYKLLQQIGEGGMGTVYMAEQTQPVQRKVALKLIKPGMDSRQVIARFEAERQALAMMDHVNIARVLDAGATEAGRPYFVMELVHGVPITKYCDDNHLTPRKRLELFVPVCQAIQHAHQKGIIHRDIKPSNVMVTLYDGKPVPKVIDFGVAKAIEQKLTERTLFTQYGTMVGTLEYMSPEQAEMSALGVDTRSDIYSLGVLLYELLTGSTPLERPRLRTAAYAEVLRLIREEEAPRPSARLSRSDTLPAIAAARKTEPAKLSRLVRGELDWIVMKTLEKDRNRRYETANALAHDIENYLHDEQVEACPPSALYRFRKFARRNKVKLATAALISVALVLLVATLAVSTVLIYREQKRTEAALAAEAEQHRRAEANFRQAQDAVDQMLTQVGEVQLAQVPRFEQVRRTLLEKALTFYDKFVQEKSDDPAIRLEAGMAYRRVGDIQLLLGQYQKAEAAYQKGIGLLEDLAARPDASPAHRQELGRAHHGRGRVLRESARQREAEEALRRALALQEKLTAEGTDPTYRMDLARSYNNLGILLGEIAQLVEAEKAHRRALQVGEQLAAEFPAVADYRKDLARYAHNLAHLLSRNNRMRDAEPLYRQAVAVADKVAADWPADRQYQMVVAGNHSSLGQFLTGTARLPEAEQQLRLAVQLHEKLAADFPDVPEYRRWLQVDYNGLGGLQVRAGQLRAGEKTLNQARAVLEKLIAEQPGLASHPSDLGNVLQNLALCIAGGENPPDPQPEQLARCRPLMEEAIRRQKAALEIQPKNQEFREKLGNHYGILAMFLNDLKAPEAEAANRQAIDYKKQLVADFPAVAMYRGDLGGSLNNFAELLQEKGRVDEARQLLLEAVEHQRAALAANPRSPVHISFLRNHCGALSETYKGMPQFAEEEKTCLRFVDKLGKVVTDRPTLSPDQYEARVNALLRETAQPKPAPKQ